MTEAIEKLLTKNKNYTPEEAETLANMCQVLLEQLQHALALSRGSSVLMATDILVARLRSIDHAIEETIKRANEISTKGE